VLTATVTAWGQYPTYPQIETTLLTAEQNHPSLAKRYNAGTSIQNRTMWFLRISDNVLVEEDEPEVALISTMHGDEVTGVVMCLNLIDYLLSNYGSDPRVTNIVDSVDLWVQPCMNPDGYVLQRRGNANNADLNRDFPDPFNSPNNTTAGRQRETGNIMTWWWGRSIALAANFHGGALVVNYPFDNNPSGSSVYTASPDDDFFIWSSEEYSRHNLPLWNSGSFFHGITNGADWYAISGGMQDWSYRWHGADHVTIELGTTKTPPYSQMPTFWNDNRESMLAYIEASLVGVRGIVTDAGSGQPLAATVAVAGRSYPAYTDSDVGDYHRLVLPGSYEMNFQAPGHDTVTAESVTVAAGSAMRQDLALGEPTMVVLPNGGESVGAGASLTIEWTGNPNVAFQVQYTSSYGATSTTTDGFESGVIGPEYTMGGNAPWGATTGAMHTGSYAAKAGSIGNSQSSSMTRTVEGGQVSFWYRVSSEANYDFLNFYIDGVREVQASGTSGTWTQYSKTLPSGHTYSLKWEYAKDTSLTGGSDTAWVDDVELISDITTWTAVTQTAPGASTAWWTPTTPGGQYKVRIRAAYGPSIFGAWDESDGTFIVLNVPVPAVSTWGVILLAILLLAAGIILQRRVRPSASTLESEGYHV
jgi:carboxypeptidase D